MNRMVAELIIWAGAVSIIAAAWCWDYRAGMLCLGGWLVLAGIGMVLGGATNADKRGP
jgi:hypothetical protein